MKTLSEVITWLKNDDHIRVILVEVENVLNGGTTPIYMSNKPFTTGTADTPANTYYDACISGGVTFSESITLDGTPSISYGDIEIVNVNGVRDSLLDYVWVNKTVNIYLGDPRWNRADFYLIFTGVVSDITSRASDVLNLVLLNKLERLNVAITEKTLAEWYIQHSYTPNPDVNTSDRTVPILFGECFNIEPTLLDSVPNLLTYIIHDGAVNSILETRDSGLPVYDLTNTGIGTFVLMRSPSNRITASVQGVLPANNRISEIIKNAVKTYGKAPYFTDSDIDLTNFSTFLTNHSQQIGIYCKDRENLLDTCQKIANSVGANLVCTSTGKLRLIKLDIDTVSTIPTNNYINTDDIVFEQIAISDKIPVRGTIKLNYCKNWTVEDNSVLAGAVPKAHVPVFEQEWYTILKEDSTVNSNYSLSSEPVAEDTYLIATADADAEATRRLTLWKTPRFILTLTCLPHMLHLELGDLVNITHPRYNLVAGKRGTVISIERDWVAGQVTIGVLI